MASELLIERRGPAHRVECDVNFERHLVGVERGGRAETKRLLAPGRDGVDGDDSSPYDPTHDHLQRSRHLGNCPDPQRAADYNVYVSGHDGLGADSEHSANDHYGRSGLDALARRHSWDLQPRSGVQRSWGHDLGCDAVIPANHGIRCDWRYG